MWVADQWNSGNVLKPEKAVKVTVEVAGVSALGRMSCKLVVVEMCAQANSSSGGLHDIRKHAGMACFGYC